MTVTVTVVVVVVAAVVVMMMITSVIIIMTTEATHIPATQAYAELVRPKSRPHHFPQMDQPNIIQGYITNQPKMTLEYLRELSRRNKTFHWSMTCAKFHHY